MFKFYSFFLTTIFVYFLKDPFNKTKLSTADMEMVRRIFGI